MVRHRKREFERGHKSMKSYFWGQFSPENSLFSPGKSSVFTIYRQKEKPANTLVYRLFWRRGRDSNPREIALKLISSQPRYDRFDTSPYMFTRNSSKSFKKYLERTTGENS